jgi:hypothetical protein
MRIPNYMELNRGDYMKYIVINNIHFEYIDLNADFAMSPFYDVYTLRTRIHISNIDIIKNWLGKKFESDVDNKILIGISLNDYEYQNFNDYIAVNFNVDQVYKITNPDLYYKQKLRKDKLIEIGKHVE